LAWVDNNGKIITQSQHTILKAAQCTPETEALHKITKPPRISEKWC
jgi:hypothetical protein